MSDVEAFLGRVEGLASRATEGPWETDDIGHSGAEEPSGIVVHTGAFDWDDLMRGEAESAVTWMPGWDRHHGDNAEFIAHARTDVPALVAALRAVLALHQPGTFSATIRGEVTAHPVCPTCHDKAGVHPCGCWREVDEEHDCLECSRPRRGAFAPWPCPTAQAIADALGVEP